MYKEDTQVLTSGGWEYVQDLIVGEDQILTNKGWELISGLIEKDHNNYVYWFGPNNNVKMTDSGRIWAAIYDDLPMEKLLNEEMNLYGIERLKDQSFIIDFRINRATMDLADPSEILCELWGWVVGSGNIVDDNAIKINTTYNIIHLLKRLKLDWIKVEDGYVIMDKDFVKQPLSNLFNYSDQCIQSFLDGADVTNCTSTILIEYYSVLLAMLGKGSEVDSKGRLRIYNQGYLLIDREDQSCEKYCGKVYLPQVNSGNRIYVRGNNNYWSGL